jgi:hypothetical protein
VQDLVDERHGRIWFWLYYASVAAAALALFAGTALAFRAGVFLQLIATLGLMRAFFRARRLSSVPASLRAPPGMVRPNLFLPMFAPRR